MKQRKIVNGQFYYNAVSKGIFRDSVTNNQVPKRRWKEPGGRGAGPGKPKQARPGAAQLWGLAVKAKGELESKQEPETANSGDTIEVKLGGRTYKERVLQVLSNGDAIVDIFGEKTLKPGEYRIIKHKGKKTAAKLPEQSTRQKRAARKSNGIGKLAKAIRSEMKNQYASYASRTRSAVKNFDTTEQDKSLPEFFQVQRPVLLSFKDWVAGGYYLPKIEYHQYDSPFLNAEAVDNIYDAYTELTNPGIHIYKNLPTRYQSDDAAYEEFGSTSLIKDIEYVFSQPYLEDIAKDLGIEPYFLSIEKESMKSGRTKPYEYNIETKEITRYKGEPKKLNYVIIPKKMIADKFKENPGKLILSVKKLLGFIDESNEAAVQEFISMAKDAARNLTEEGINPSPKSISK